jgi:TonB family protein
MRKTTVGPVSVSALFISAMLHAGGLVALAWVDWGGPVAPGVSGGGGGGGPFVVEIEPEREGPGDAPPEEPTAPVPESEPMPPGEAMGPVTPELETAAPAPPFRETPPPAQPVADHPSAEPSLGLAAPAAIVEPARAAPVPPPTPSPPAAAIPEPEIAPREPTTATAQQPPVASGQSPAAGGDPGAEGPAIEDPGALRPVYPRSCLRARHQGTSVVRAFLGEDGRPVRVEILRSAGCPELDRAALDAMLHARYRPARSWGRPVASTVDQPFQFLLKGRTF